MNIFVKNIIKVNFIIEPLDPLFIKMSFDEKQKNLKRNKCFFLLADQEVHFCGYIFFFNAYSIKQVFEDRVT